jgi:hypothetical protein
MIRRPYLFLACAVPLLLGCATTRATPEQEMARLQMTMKMLEATTAAPAPASPIVLDNGPAVQALNTRAGALEGMLRELLDILGALDTRIDTVDRRQLLLDQQRQTVLDHERRLLFLEHRFTRPTPGREK